MLQAFFALPLTSRFCRCDNSKGWGVEWVKKDESYKGVNEWWKTFACLFVVTSEKLWRTNCVIIIHFSWALCAFKWLTWNASNSWNFIASTRGRVREFLRWNSRLNYCFETSPSAYKIYRFLSRVGVWNFKLLRYFGELCGGHVI